MTLVLFPYSYRLNLSFQLSFFVLAGRASELLALVLSKVSIIFNIIISIFEKRVNYKYCIVFIVCLLNLVNFIIAVKKNNFFPIKYSL